MGMGTTPMGTVAVGTLLLTDTDTDTGRARKIKLCWGLRATRSGVTVVGRVAKEEGKRKERKGCRFDRGRKGAFKFETTGVLK